MPSVSAVSSWRVKLRNTLTRLFVSLVAGLVVIAGVVVRRRSSRRVGSAMIGLGVLPSVLPIVLFWFPPALLYGALAIAVSVTAFSDAAAARKLATI